MVHATSCPLSLMLAPLGRIGGFGTHGGDPRGFRQSYRDPEWQALELIQIQCRGRLPL